MKSIFSDLAYDITQTIKGSGRIILMYDEDGNRTYDQRQASKIFAYPDKMMIIITDDGIDSSVDVGLSNSTDVPELQDFITTLRHLCSNYNVLFNIQKYGKEIEPKDFANFGSSDDLSECLDYYNTNRVDELFKGDSDVEIEKVSNKKYTFTIDRVDYFVEDYQNQLLFGCMNYDNEDEDDEIFSPNKKNKNQFIILNTVLSCIKNIFKNNNEDYMYFSGNIDNGLSKLYSIMFNRLKDESKKYGYIPLFTEEKYFDVMDSVWINSDYEDYWYFIKPNTEILYKAEDQELPFIKNKERTDELFKGDSDIEITYNNTQCNFSLDNIDYVVESQGGNIVFAQVINGRYIFKPIKNNKNQFIILNTVLKCVDYIIKKNNTYGHFYFSGDINNGLAKLYSIMFNKLKDKVKQYGFEPIYTRNEHFSSWDEKWVKEKDEKYWYFIDPTNNYGKYILNMAKEQNLPFVKQITNESLYGSKKSSYEKDGKCKLIIRHNKQVDETKRNSRTRNIDKIFLETSEGERIKCPVKNLKGARAWAKYVNKNGIIEDENTDRLFSLVEDLQCMKELKRHLYKNKNSLNESSLNEISNLSDGIKQMNKMLNSASRTGKIPEVKDIEVTEELNEIFMIEDEELLERAKRAKRRQMSLLAPVIQSEDIVMENEETPFTKYAKKWLSNNGLDTDDNSVDNLAKGLKEIVDDNADYTIDFDPNDQESETVRKFANNIDCEITKTYVENIANKLENNEEMGTVEKQILRHILNGVDTDENIEEDIGADDEDYQVPQKQIPTIGDQVMSESGIGTVVDKNGFDLKIQLENNSIISESALNVSIKHKSGKKEIKEMTILENFFNQF